MNRRQLKKNLNKYLKVINMKNINKFFIVFLFLILQAGPAFSFYDNSENLEIELVGMPAPVDPDELNNSKPTRDPIDEVNESGNPPEITDRPDSPVEYDPNNPYAEWER